jgi:hypothetical protein
LKPESEGDFSLKGAWAPKATRRIGGFEAIIHSAFLLAGNQVRVYMCSPMVWRTGVKMNLIKIISGILVIALGAGCASTKNRPSGSNGPKIVASGKTTENGPYAEVGVEFSTMGDFVALFAPSRWRSPIATGGTLSWLNPNAWNEDAGRTGRILIGEAVIIGGIVAVANNDSGGGGGGGSPGPVPPPPPGDGGTPPPPPAP